MVKQKSRDDWLIQHLHACRFDNGVLQQAGERGTGRPASIMAALDKATLVGGLGGLGKSPVHLKHAYLSLKLPVSPCCVFRW